MKKKLVLIITAVVLVAAIIISGTVAYLTAQTSAITNTFTIGNITLTLTETFNAKSVDTLEANDIWKGKIIPGDTQAKDPTLTVGANSENCYVYALVDNTVVIPATSGTGNTVVATPNINTTNWVVVTTSGTKTLYRYASIVNTATTDTTLPVFTQVAYASDIASENVNALNNTTIVVKGFAHQSDSVTQTVADDAAIAWMNS